MEIFNLGDLVITKIEFTASWFNPNYFYIINPNGAISKYYFDNLSGEDKITLPEYFNMYSDIFTELKGNYEKK